MYSGVISMGLRDLMLKLRLVWYKMGKEERRAGDGGGTQCLVNGHDMGCMYRCIGIMNASIGMRHLSDRKLSVAMCELVGVGRGRLSMFSMDR